MRIYTHIILNQADSKVNRTGGRHSLLPGKIYKKLGFSPLFCLEAVPPYNKKLESAVADSSLFYAVRYFSAWLFLGMVATLAVLAAYWNLFHPMLFCQNRS